MELLLDFSKLGLGGLLLYLGAEWLVKGSAGLARAFGVKPLVIGLTVVAYGTSAPELAVGSVAMLDGKSEIVLGTVIGSCVANLGLILGITALISPPAVDGRLIRREVPVLVVSALALVGFMWNGSIGWLEAAALLAGSMLFTFWTLTSEASESIATGEQIERAAEVAGAPGGTGKLRMGLITLVGLALLVGGGEVFVQGAVGIAKALEITDRVIGLTVIAIGTSLPELAACVVAALRGHASIAVGNVVGSNIFNIFLILGVVPFIAPVEVPLASIKADLVFLVAITLFGALTMRGDRRVARPEGVLLVLAYASFIALAFLRS